MLQWHSRSRTQGSFDTVAERAPPNGRSDRTLFFMAIDWRIYFRAALREEDPAKLPHLVERARRAINDRLQERGTKGPDTGEREELEEGVRQLNLHELKRKSAPH